MESLFDTGATDSSAYYVWEVPGKPITVRIAPEAIDRILADGLRGMGLIPRRGTEVGGVLLGTAEEGDTITVRVEDALPVQIDYLFGPAYNLSSKDKEKLREVISERGPASARETYVVGFFRTNMQDQMALTQDDLELMAEFFSSPSDVVLLVKPRALRSSLAGLFFWEGGHVRAESSYLEFPVRSRKASGKPETAPEPEPSEPEPGPESVPLPSFLGAAPAREKKKEREAPAPETESVPLPSFLGAALPKEKREPEAPRLPQVDEFGVPTPLEPAGQPLWVSWWVQVPILICLLMVDGLLGFFSAQQASPIASAARTQAPRDPYSLTLMVVKYGDNLLLSWDRNAPAVTSARNAVLTITDGALNRTIDLTVAQLRNGSVVYRRLTDQVRFRLEIQLDKGRSVSETWDLTPREPVTVPPAQPDSTIPPLEDATPKQS